MTLYAAPRRHTARVVAHALQHAIDERDATDGSVAEMTAMSFRLIRQHRVPRWVHGVRVERAGLKHVVVGIEERGR